MVVPRPLPGALIAARVLEIRPTLATGLKGGIAAATLDTVLLLFVGVLGARVPGRDRRDVLLDFLMHPMARRAVAGAIRTLIVVPRALWRRLRRPRWREFAYHRGSNELGFALAILPAVVAEDAAVPAPPRCPDMASPRCGGPSPLRAVDASRPGPRLPGPSPSSDRPVAAPAHGPPHAGRRPARGRRIGPARAPAPPRARRPGASRRRRRPSS